VLAREKRSWKREKGDAHTKGRLCPPENQRGREKSHKRAGLTKPFRGRQNRKPGQQKKKNASGETKKALDPAGEENQKRNDGGDRKTGGWEK